MRAMLRLRKPRNHTDMAILGNEICDRSPLALGRMTGATSAFEAGGSNAMGRLRLSAGRVFDSKPERFGLLNSGCESDKGNGFSGESGRWRLGAIGSVSGSVGFVNDEFVSRKASLLES